MTQGRRSLLATLFQIAMLAVFASGAFAASAAEENFSAAMKKFYAMDRGELGAQEVLDAMLAVDDSALEGYDKAHRAFYLGDLYYRVGDYEKCKEWTSKVIDAKELFDIPVYKNKEPIYPHGLTAVAILANAAAEFGKPEDILMLESKVAPDDMVARVFIHYCWTGSPQNSMRTILRFYKALAYKNAGNPEAVREILQMNRFTAGEIWVGDKIMPLQEAAKLLAE